jgi:hypothetical protein
VKTFFFLRIYPILTPIIVMLKNVVWDLKIFLFFYLILISLFSQLLAVIGLGNNYKMQMIDQLDENGYVLFNSTGDPVQIESD